MYLLDTNIFLEVLLNQAKADEVKVLFEKAEPSLLYASDFSLYSIGILLIKHREYSLYQQFINDVVVNGSVAIVSLTGEELKKVGLIASQITLDFDDAYQYAIAEKYNLTIVSYDAHFDATDRGRMAPAQLFTI
jgi:predicted nucleic acid-binding protein